VIHCCPEFDQRFQKVTYCHIGNTDLRAFDTGTDRRIQSDE
jgi:hypothetical protein